MNPLNGLILFLVLLFVDIKNWMIRWSSEVFTNFFSFFENMSFISKPQASKLQASNKNKEYIDTFLQH
jgi:hypothetical protein